MAWLYKLACWIGLHKVGAVRQWGGGRPNSRCEHCGMVIWWDHDGRAHEEDDDGQ